MSEFTEDTGEPRPGRSGGLLLFAAVAAIAIPALVGVAVLKSNSSSTGTPTGLDTDVGGGMATTTDDSDAVPLGVEAFSTIQASEIVIEPDPAGGAAVLTVSTTVDVVCAVAYGPTTDLGSLATDSDMAGGAHAVHQPVLRGLTPGVTYWYRMGGIGPDGKLYLSDLMQYTFSGEGGRSVEPPAPNIAAGAAVVAVSSEFSDAYGAVNAVDGSTSTEWSSSGDGDAAFIEIDLGGDFAVAGVGFRSRSMTDGTSITTSFTITVDGETTYGPFEAGPGLSVALVEFQGRVIRFDVETSTGGNTGAIEVEVYGAPAADDDDDM
jgi:hypothetical protein